MVLLSFWMVVSAGFIDLVNNRRKMQIIHLSGKLVQFDVRPAGR